MNNKTTTETREVFKIISRASRIWYEQGRQEEALLHSHQVAVTNQIMQLIQQEKQDLLVSLLDKYNEVDEECEKAGYGTGFVNYVGILESWIEDFEKLAELKGEK